ncbi:MAG: ATP-binding protein, partial [Verrucomicrobiota bacterium]
MNPFPGLRPFRIDEKYLFFGREEQTAELVQRLGAKRFLAVVGTSGSGKSSLVQAWLLPHLYGGTMLDAGFRWELAVMRPGGDPLTHLARALIDAELYGEVRESSPFEIRATLSRSRRGLVEAVRQSSMEAEDNLLVVVDQFEELFRFRRSSRSNLEEASAFVKLLIHASQQTEIPVYIVLTMRSDYLGDCSEFAGLAEAVNSGEYLIPRLDREQRRTTIAGPIRVGGGEITSRLLQKLLNDVGDNPDHLPVLQHALMRTWNCWETERNKDEPLDLHHYEAVGGMEEALSRHADEVFLSLPDDDHRGVAERLFKALTERGSDGRGIRRPGCLRDLCAVANADIKTVITIIDQFRQLGRTFLMPGVAVELQQETVIDISHESLMRVWLRLKGWVEDESQSARIYRRLRETAELHAEEKAGLYHQPDLEIALSWREESAPNDAWAQQYGGQFAKTMAFLEESEEAARRTER